MPNSKDDKAEMIELVGPQDVPNSNSISTPVFKVGTDVVLNAINETKWNFDESVDVTKQNCKCRIQMNS